MNKFLLIFIILCYLGLLFFIAYWADKKAKKKWVNHPLVYVLSLGVYCSAWTFYGSVGVASKSWVDFLPIYLGPVIALPLWIVVMRKVIHLSKNYNISGLADFISLRYGNNRNLGAIVTLVCLVAIIPYVALQIKAVSETLQILIQNPEQNENSFQDYALYITIVLAIFSAFFGTRSSDASSKKTGLVFAVAFESFLKLFFFLLIGFYICFYLFDNPASIFEQIQIKKPELLGNQFETLNDGFNWFSMICLSFFAIFLLPRQFQLSVIEYTERNQLKKAIWGFPLYLFLFNIFVVFIAWAGIILLPENETTDYFALLIPISQGHKVLGVLAFLGGFSAVISMVVVSTVALANMVSNNVIIPFGFLKTLTNKTPLQTERRIKQVRRILVILLILLAYVLYSGFRKELPLISIGLIAFVVIAQLAPSFFIGLYWNRGSSLGAKLGIVSGMFIVAVTLLIPFAEEVIFNAMSLQTQGYFGSDFLKANQLFGIQFLEPIPHSFFWSITVNTLVYLVVSIFSDVSYRERNYAEIIVQNRDIFNLQENAFVWKGEAYFKDIEQLLHKFLGGNKANRAVDIFRRKYNVSPDEKLADAKFINFSEKLLTGTIGSASAKILVDSVVKENPVSLQEVLHILEENKKTQDHNQTLKEQSDALSKLSNDLKLANEELVKQDQLKDEFLDTLAHELKTPVTSIKLASEVLEDEEMPSELRTDFVQNIIEDSNRLEVLIHNILDYEKLNSRRQKLNFSNHNFNEMMHQVISIFNPIATKNQVKIQFNPTENPMVEMDKDRMIQVFTNLINNAFKFVPDKNGQIQIEYKVKDTEIHCSVSDNGSGIDAQDLPYIFDKFYQAKNQASRNIGSGFGLAICKQIIDLHNGNIYADSNYKNGAKINIEIPITQTL